MEAIGIELNGSMFGEPDTATVSVAYATGRINGKVTGPWNGDLGHDAAKLFASASIHDLETLAAHARALVDALEIAINNA